MIPPIVFPIRKMIKHCLHFPFHGFMKNQFGMNVVVPSKWAAKVTDGERP